MEQDVQPAEPQAILPLLEIGVNCFIYRHELEDKLLGSPVLEVECKEIGPAQSPRKKLHIHL